MAIKINPEGGFTIDWPQVAGILGTVLVLMAGVFWVGDHQWLTLESSRPILEHVTVSDVKMTVMEDYIERVAQNSRDDQVRSWDAVRSIRKGMNDMKNEQVKQGTKQDSMLDILIDLKASMNRRD